MVDFGYDEEMDYDPSDYYYEEEDVLIAEVTHTCCGKVQAYFNCNSEDVPAPETICRDCCPRVEGARDADGCFDPFSDEAV